MAFTRRKNVNARLSTFNSLFIIIAGQVASRVGSPRPNRLGIAATLRIACSDASESPLVPDDVCFDRGVRAKFPRFNSGERDQVYRGEFINRDTSRADPEPSLQEALLCSAEVK